MRAVNISFLLLSPMENFPPSAELLTVMIRGTSAAHPLDLSPRTSAASGPTERFLKVSILSSRSPAPELRALLATPRSRPSTITPAIRGAGGAGGAKAGFLPFFFRAPGPETWLFKQRLRQRGPDGTRRISQVVKQAGRGLCRKRPPRPGLRIAGLKWARVLYQYSNDG